GQGRARDPGPDQGAHSDRPFRRARRSGQGRRVRRRRRRLHHGTADQHQRRHLYVRMGPRCAGAPVSGAAVHQRPLAALTTSRNDVVPAWQSVCTSPGPVGPDDVALGKEKAMKTLAPWGGELRREMERFFDRFAEPMWGPIETMAGDWAPKLDMSETKDAFVV